MGNAQRARRRLAGLARGTHWKGAGSLYVVSWEKKTGTQRPAKKTPTKTYAARVVTAKNTMLLHFLPNPARFEPRMPHVSNWVLCAVL